MDIKYVYIQGEKRNALLLTILDVYTRSILSQELWWHIRKEQVIWLVHRMLQEHSTKGITLRNDNGSQFIAHVVREYLHDQGIEQEFIHVATPEENCFIEAYHSILEKQLLETTEFQDIEEALAVFNRWKVFYNERRRHGSLGQCPPKEVWDAYENTNFARSGEADVGSAGVQPTRNSLTDGEDPEGRSSEKLLLPFPNSSLSPCLQKPIENSLTVFEKLSKK